ncbi:MAG: diaminopimelate decarboxylase [Oscillospiraceae bacterium]|nr:diaminopimelate decarboxylase [Oscillospiraceae bacterium]
MPFVMNNLSVMENRLAIGGVKISSLVRKFGTPLYIMDEDKIRENCREYVRALKENYPGESQILYASKAFCCKGIYPIIESEGLGADIVSGGELYTANLADMPGEKLVFHGNNKSENEIELAMEHGIYSFVVDGEYDLKLINRVADEMGKIANILIRIKPGVEVHTHEFIQTGQEDCKFGVSLLGDEAYNLFKVAKDMANIKFLGMHCHIGSQVFETEGFTIAISRLAELARKLKDELDINTRELNLGGGQGIKYVEADKPMTIKDFAAHICQSVAGIFKDYELPLPKLILEPGRAIVGDAGLTAYTVGAIKDIPGHRKYISVDGGMGDNPRFALYGSEYTALRVHDPLDRKTELVTIAGKCCESGDIIAENCKLPKVESEDLIVIQCTGAYNYSMASNYNRIPRPPVVIVKDGQSRVLIKRESYEDIGMLDK